MGTARRAESGKAFWKYLPGAVCAQPSFSGDRAVKSALDVKNKMTADCSRAGWNIVVRDNIPDLHAFHVEELVHRTVPLFAVRLTSDVVVGFGTETTAAIVKQAKSKSRA